MINADTFAILQIFDVLMFVLMAFYFEITSIINYKRYSIKSIKGKQKDLKRNCYIALAFIIILNVVIIVSIQK